MIFREAVHCKWKHFVIENDCVHYYTRLLFGCVLNEITSANTEQPI